jgi:hypothetical protein
MPHEEGVPEHLGASSAPVAEADAKTDNFFRKWVFPQ